MHRADRWSAALVSVLLGASQLALGQEDDASAQTAAGQIVQASLPELADPGQSLRDAMDAYYRSGSGQALRALADRRQVFMSEGQAEVQVGPEHPQWGKFRVMAYEKALIDAEADLVQRRGLLLQTEKLQRYFSDTDRPVPDFEPEGLADSGQLGRIVGKLLSVTEGRLDQVLDELGVDRAAFKAAPPAQRHVLFQRALSLTSTREALASLTGVLTVKTFEAFNDAGEHMIGVVIVQSDKLKQFADQVVNARGDIAPDADQAGRPIHEVISANPAALLDEFGVRRLYDEAGYPVLISYGQSANPYRGEDNRKRRRHRETAQKVAEASADAAIAGFVASKAQWRDETSVQELIEEAVKVHPDGFDEPEDVRTVVNTLLETFQSRARANITGLSTVYTWARAHPFYPDQEIVGVVRMYSPRSERAARGMDGPPAVKPPPRSQASGQTGVRSSQDLMDINDF